MSNGRLPYRHLPLQVTSFDGSALGILVFMELHRRVFGNQFGTLPKPLSDDAFAMRGYCLDAPNTMPAGGCYYDEFAPPDPHGDRNWIVMQFTVDREPSA